MDSATRRHNEEVGTSIVEVSVGTRGFFAGVNPVVTTVSKAAAAILVIIAMVFPTRTIEALTSISDFLLHNLNWFYLFAASGFVIFSIGLAISPFGKVKFGAPDEKPEYSNFSWFSMMFGAGMGVGLLFFSIGEPLTNISGGPAVLMGAVEGNTEAAIQPALRYSFLHYGLHPWGIYVSVGLALAYFSYTRRQPLTIRGTLMPLFGKSLNGTLGNVIDILAVLATLLGISTSVGLGLMQLISGVAQVTGMTWLLDAQSAPTAMGIIVTLAVVMGMSTISALSGVGRGVKWLSNLNLGLSGFLLLVFALFGSLGFMLKLYGTSLIDYLMHLPQMGFTVWERGTPLGDWQTGWTVLNWAWWIAFAPFTGLFLARISRGRTIREFVFGALIMPAMVSFLWFALLGGTAIEQVIFEGQSSISESVISSQLFATINVLMSPAMAQMMSGLVVVLILTYLVTSADSGVLVLNTIISGGRVHHTRMHRVVWGLLLTLMIGSLMLAGGLEAIKQAMLVGSMPFTVIMILMCISTLMSLFTYRKLTESKETTSEAGR